MEKKIEYEWEKYEKKITEIEARLERVSSRGRETAAVRATSRLEVCCPVKAAAEDNELNSAGARLEEAVKLKEEIDFLKAEIKQASLIKQEAQKLKYDIEAVSAAKDAEIMNLYNEKRILKNENDFLKLKTNKEKLESFARHSSRRRRHSGKNGLLSWLKKPLITIAQGY